MFPGGLESSSLPIEYHLENREFKARMDLPQYRPFIDKLHFHEK